jgi:hypothetical protein
MKVLAETGPLNKWIPYDIEFEGTGELKTVHNLPVSEESDLI